MDPRARAHTRTESPVNSLTFSPKILGRNFQSAKQTSNLADGNAESLAALRLRLNETDY